MLARLRALLKKARAPSAGAPGAGGAEAAGPTGSVRAEERLEDGGAGEPAFARFARVLGVELPEDAAARAAEDVRLTSALADLREPAFAARAAAEVVQSAGALGLDPYAARAILADLRQSEARTGASYALGPSAR